MKPLIQKERAIPDFGRIAMKVLVRTDKVVDNVNFGCGTIGTEQRGSKVVVISCSRDFLNETLDLEGKI